jgi:pimeloyl-ACP methyl ester carboxylesterase
MKRIDLPKGHLTYTDVGWGDPVVLLHAGYLDHTMWDQQIAQLSQRYRVLAPDARTHGLSSTATAPFRHCDDVAGLLRHLDAAPAVLIGISMGAGAALDTAIEHPDVVRGIVVCGAGTSEPYFDDPWLLTIVGRLERAIADLDPAAWVEAELDFAAGPRRSLTDLDPNVVARLRQMHEHFASTHATVPGVTPPTPVRESWARLSEITVPVLGIVGSEDSDDHRLMTQRAVTAVQHGRGIATISGAGHYPNLERPKEWSRTIERFLSNLGMPDSGYDSQREPGRKRVVDRSIRSER